MYSKLKWQIVIAFYGLSKILKSNVSCSWLFHSPPWRPCDL